MPGLSLPNTRNLGAASILALGFGLFLAWIWAAGFGSILSVLQQAGDADLLMRRVFPAVVTVAFFSVALVPLRFEPLRRPMRIAAPLLASAGSGIAAFANHQTFMDPLWLAGAGVVVMAIGYAACTLLWYETFAEIADVRQLGLTVAAGHLLSGPIYSLLVRIPWSEWVVPVAALLPLASLAAFRVRDTTPADLREKVRPQVRHALILQLGVFAIGQVILRALEPGGIWGISGSPVSMAQSPLRIAIASVLFVLAFIFAVTLQSDRRIDTRYRIAILVLIAGFMALPAWAAGGQDDSALRGIVGWALELYCYALGTLLVVDSSRRLRFSPVSVFGVYCGLQFVVVLVWAVLFKNAGAPVYGVIAPVIYALVVIVAVVPTRLLWGGRESGSAGDPRQADAVCAAIAREYNLTPREEAVLQLLVEGCSIPYIKTELVIAEGTAKKHVSHIYEKLDVHTRQELLALVFGFSAEKPAPVRRP